MKQWRFFAVQANPNTHSAEFLDPVYAKKKSPKHSFSLSENERFGLVFENTGFINSGTVLYMTVYRVQCAFSASSRKIMPKIASWWKILGEYFHANVIFKIFTFCWLLLWYILHISYFKRQNLLLSISLQILLLLSNGSSWINIWESRCKKKTYYTSIVYFQTIKAQCQRRL